MNHLGEKVKIRDKPGFYDGLKKLYSSRERTPLNTCMHWGEICSSPIGSHSISRSWLEQIAENGHVGSLRLNVERAPHEAVRVVLESVGIKQASVFPGFCQDHDSQLFTPLECHPFAATPEQLHLLAYRSVCREACAKHQVVRFQLEQGMLESKPTPHGERAVRDIFMAIELLALKQELDGPFASREFSLMEHFVIRFSKTPTVLVSTHFIPLITATGRRLECRLKDRLSMSVFPGAAGGFAVFSWMKSAPKNGSLFVKSLGTLTSERLTDVIVRLILEVSDNFFFSLSWWNSLGPNQERLKSAFARNITMGDDTPPPDLFAPSGSFIGDWKLEERHFV